MTSTTPMRLCTICARGGSTGVPGKNVLEIDGLPLVAHSIGHAIESGLFELVVVDSDSDEILSVAEAHGAHLTLKRPAELATATAGKLEVIQRAAVETERVTGLEFSTFVDLDTTAPLRLAEDIVGAVALLEETEAANVITGAPAHRSPYFNLVEVDSTGIAALSKPSGIVRRQDAPAAFDLNASVYAWKRLPFLERPFLFGPSTRLYEMPRERSFDIDEPLDVRIVTMIMQDRQ